MSGILDAFTKLGSQIITTGGDVLAQKISSKAPQTALTPQSANPESNYNKPTVAPAPSPAAAPGMSQQTMILIAGAGVLGVVALVLLTRSK